MRTFLIVFLLLLLFGAFPVWPYSAHWGYYPGISLGTILLITFIFVLMSNKRIA